MKREKEDRLRGRGRERLENYDEFTKSDGAKSGHAKQSGHGGQSTRDAGATADAPAALFVGTWNKTTTYGQGMVCSSGNALWQSLVAGNLGNSPAASPAAWTLILSAPSGAGLADLHIQLVAGGTATLAVGRWGWM